MTFFPPHQPYFSVIVPVHNAAATIHETIASILAQSDSDFELIVIDDGSTDDSLVQLLRLAGKDERIRVVAQANAGVSAARNNAVSIAKGRLLAFCDADDLWKEHKLSRHRTLHEASPDIVISYGQIAFLQPDARRSRTVSSVPAGDLSITAIISENPVCTTSNLVVTRQAFNRIGGFAEGMQYAEDQEWLARAVSMGERAVGIDELLVGYRLSPGGLSVNLERMYKGWRELVALHGDGERTNAAEAIFCRYLARRSLRSGNPPAEARRYVLRGLALDRKAFLSDIRRGATTLIAAFSAGLLPGSIRQRIFA